MIKVKDGYAKLIGTTYSGSASRVLLSNGGDHVLGNANGNIPLNNGTVSTNLNADMLDGLHIHTGRNNEANKVVRTDASGYILAGWINTTSGDMGTTAATRIYCSNDGYIRYKTPANFFETLANDGNQISITVGSQNRKLTVNYATTSGRVIINLHTSNNTEYPIIWTNSNNTTNAVAADLFKSYSHLTYNPSARRIISGQYLANNSSGPHFTAQSTTGNWAYLRLHNGSTYWDIATRSTSGSGGLWLARLSGADNGIFVSTGNNVGISTSSPSYKLHVAGDAYATGWSRAGSGFYVEGKGVHYMSNNANGLGQIYLTSNEFNWSASGAALYFNYRASANGTTVTLYIWNAGSSSTYASHTLGALTSRGDLSLYGLTSTCNKANDAGYMNSALQIREYNFGGSQSDTWAIAPRLSWHWSGRVQTQIGLSSSGDLKLSKDNFATSYLLLHLGNSSITDYNVKIGGTTKLFVRDWGHGAANMNAVARGGRSSMGMADLSTPSGGTATAVNPNGGTSWHHFINIAYTDGGAGSNSWITQIANKAGTTDLWVRSRSGGTISDTANWTAGWTRILTGTNYSSVLDGRYYTESEADSRFVNVTGDTMTGPLNMSTGTAINLWDDSASASHRLTLRNQSDIGRIYNYTGSAYGAMYLGHDGTSAIVITSGQLIGIGTGSPADKLHVNGGYIRSTANSKYIRIGTENSSHTHYTTDASISHWFNKRVDVNGAIWRYNTNYGIDSDGKFYAHTVYANRSGSGTAGGVSLYSNSDPMTYGIASRNTADYGTHGYVTGDWATYLTMSNTSNRGWIFRTSDGTRRLSINAQGHLYANGLVNADRFNSRVATGTLPYACTSTTCNTNLNADLLDGKHASAFALASHGVHWEGFTKRANSNASWGTLIASNGYTPLFWLDSTTSGGVAFSDKGGQTFMQIDGYFYQNEGKYRVTDVTETVTDLGTSGNNLTWTKNGTTNNITIPYASSAGALGTYSIQHFMTYDNSNNNYLAASFTNENFSKKAAEKYIEYWDSAGGWFNSRWGLVLAISGFHRVGSSDSYVLLGGGGHKLESNLSVNYANSAGTSSNVVVNNSDANSTYRMVWHSGNTLYGTNNIYCNPSADLIYSAGFRHVSYNSASYLLRSDGGAAGFHWSGLGGQPTWLWGGNSQHTYYVYNPSNFNVNSAAVLRGNASNPNNSHPGHGAKVFYSWNTGQANNASSGYSNGITIGSHPNDTAYGFQIVQNMWDDRTYTRRYNGGWLSWKTLAWTSDIPNPANYYWANIRVSASSSTGTLPTFNTCWTSNWFRSTSATGWYNETYLGGIHMLDSTWVRTYNGKSFYCSAVILAGNRIYTGYDSGEANSISCSNWFRSSGISGWYNPTYGCHVYPNNINTYGGLVLRGTKNGYHGFILGENTNYMNLMDNSNDKGLYQEGKSWILYYNRGYNRVGLLTSSLAGYAVTTGGDVYIRSGWVRTEGATGWYNESYGGGMYMEDSTWVRVYGGRKFYVSNSEYSAIHSAGGVYVAGAVHSYANLLKSTCNSRTISIGSLNSSFCHYSTDAPAHWFNTSVLVQGHVYGGSSYNRRLAYVDELPTNSWRGVENVLTSTSTSNSLTANMGRVLANGASDRPIVLLAGTLYRSGASSSYTTWYFTGYRHRSISSSNPTVYVSGGVARFYFTNASGYGFSFAQVCANHQASGEATGYQSGEYQTRSSGLFWFGTYAYGSYLYIRAIALGDRNNDTAESYKGMWTNYSDGVTRVSIIAVGYAW